MSWVGPTGTWLGAVDAGHHLPHEVQQKASEFLAALGSKEMEPLVSQLGVDHPRRIGLARVKKFLEGVEAKKLPHGPLLVHALHRDQNARLLFRAPGQPCAVWADPPPDVTSGRGSCAVSVLRLVQDLLAGADALPVPGLGASGVHGVSGDGAAVGGVPGEVILGPGQNRFALANQSLLKTSNVPTAAEGMFQGVRFTVHDPECFMKRQLVRLERGSNLPGGRLPMLACLAAGSWTYWLQIPLTETGVAQTPLLWALKAGSQGSQIAYAKMTCTTLMQDDKPEQLVLERGVRWETMSSLGESLDSWIPTEVIAADLDGRPGRWLVARYTRRGGTPTEQMLMMQCLELPEELTS